MPIPGPGDGLGAPCRFPVGNSLPLDIRSLLEDTRCMTNMMTPAETAAADQAAAKERSFEIKAARAALVFLWVMFSLAIYAWLGIRGDVPLPSWSPVGQQQQEQQEQRYEPPPPENSVQV